MKNVNTAREPFDSPSGRTDVVERSGTAPSSAFGFGPSNRLLHKFREGFGITKSLEAEANLPYEEEYASRKTEKPQTSAKFIFGIEYE
jgi:outer membrane receptor for monomeric catechols